MYKHTCAHAAHTDRSGERSHGFANTTQLVEERREMVGHEKTGISIDEPQTQDFTYSEGTLEFIHVLLELSKKIKSQSGEKHACQKRMHSC